VWKTGRGDIERDGEGRDREGFTDFRDLFFPMGEKERVYEIEK
jgi:hypothetical protein